jgi:hypothetical protein
MASDELVRLVAKLRSGEVRMARCGRDLITWYDGVRKDFGPALK